MSKGETARKNYEAARNEIVVRIKLRDQVQLVYLAAVATILGIALENEENQELLLSIPFIALGITILVSHHNIAIGYLGRFCGEEISIFLKNSLKPSEYAPQWDNSFALRDQVLGNNHRLRVWGHVLIILAPCILAITINWKHINSEFPTVVIWWFSLVCLIIAVSIIISTHSNRIRQYNGRWNKKPKK